MASRPKLKCSQEAQLREVSGLSEVLNQQNPEGAGQVRGWALTEGFWVCPGVSPLLQKTSQEFSNFVPQFPHL